MTLPATVLVAALMDVFIREISLSLSNVPLSVSAVKLPPLVVMAPLMSMLPCIVPAAFVATVTAPLEGVASVASDAVSATAPLLVIEPALVIVILSPALAVTDAGLRVPPIALSIRISSAALRVMLPVVLRAAVIFKFLSPEPWQVAAATQPALPAVRESAPPLRLIEAPTVRSSPARAWRICLPWSVRAGMFCKFGSDDDSRPVAATVWLNDV